ncbi:MAG: response regulator, partial [Desulfovibrionaceae bacterium]
RTPLSGVLGMLQLLKQDPDDPDRAEYLDVALRSTRGLMTVLGDILDLSTIERGVFAVRTTAFEPREVAREVLGGFEPLAQAKGLEMETRLDPGMPEELLGDAGRLRQILFNLVGNAVKFTAQGRVRLEMSLPDGPAGAPRRLLCSVVDTGIGIPDDKIEAVLEPFTQADGSLSRHFGGVGLGLSIVRRLVHLLGGNLQIASRPGQGTEVLFTMPVSLLDDAVALAPAAAVRPGPEPDGPDERRRILAVEDDPGLQLLLRRMLERHDLRVDTASDGAEALDRLAHGRFDLVLMDVQMPSMDGCEAVRAIRSGARPGVDPAVPVVAISAHALPEDRARALEAGMDDYLTKPFTAGDLLGIIKRWAPRRPAGES